MLIEMLRNERAKHRESSYNRISILSLPHKGRLFFMHIRPGVLTLPLRFVLDSWLDSCKNKVRTGEQSAPQYTRLKERVRMAKELNNEEYVSETVWRLTEEDFRCVIAERYPLLTDNESAMLIDMAHQRFNIDSWSDYVDAFLSIHADDVKDDSE